MHRFYESISMSRQMGDGWHYFLTVQWTNRPGHRNAQTIDRNAANLEALSVEDAMFILSEHSTSPNTNHQYYLPLFQTNHSVISSFAHETGASQNDSGTDLSTQVQIQELAVSSKGGPPRLPPTLSEQVVTIARAENAFIATNSTISILETGFAPSLTTIIAGAEAVWHSQSSRPQIVASVALCPLWGDFGACNGRIEADDLMTMASK